MDITLVALPQTQDRIGEIASFVGGLLEKGSLSTADRNALRVYAARLEEMDMARVVADSQTALAEDPNFYGVNQSLKTFPDCDCGIFRRKWHVSEDTQTIS